MKIQYEGEELEFDLDELTVGQASQLKRKLGLTLLGLEEGLGQADPDALRAIFWLCHIQAGKPCDLDTLDFKVLKFAKAVLDAANAEADEANKTADEDGPKEP